MTCSADVRSLFDAISGPAFLVSARGRITAANRAAVALLGRDPAGDDVAVLDPDDPAGVRTFVWRASGSTQPTLGRLRPKLPDGSVRVLRCHGQRLASAATDDARNVLIQCVAIEERFAALADRVRELNAEVRRRRHIQAVLEESLRERDLLMRELHHRVKNNLQVVSGLLSAACAETSSEDARMALRDAAARVGAIATVQHVLYAHEQADTVRADTIVERLIESLRAGGTLEGCRPTLSLAEVALPIEAAAPLALILNELVTNAAKHGRRDGAPVAIHIGLAQTDGETILSIADDGPGFDLTHTRKRASGLGLVRGLLRQIGGRIEVANRDGATCTIRLRTQPDEDAPDDPSRA